MNDNPISQRVFTTLLQRHTPSANRKIITQNINRPVKRQLTNRTRMRTRVPLVLGSPKTSRNTPPPPDTGIRPRLPQHRLQRLRSTIGSRTLSLQTLETLTTTSRTKSLVPTLSLKKRATCQTRTTHTTLTGTTATTPPTIIMRPTHPMSMNRPITPIHTALTLS